MMTKTITLKDGIIAYDDMGTGPLVVCVPGMGTTRGEYRFFAPRLAAAGFRVVTMDLRGHGESSANWPDYAVDALGSDVIALLRALESGPALLVGNSVGGGAAVWAAAEAPELVGGLLLIDPSVRGEMNGPFRMLVSAIFTRPWGPTAWVKYYNGLFKTRKPDDLDAFSAMLLRMLREPGRMVALRRMMLASQNESAVRLARVTAPTLVLMGSRDPDFKDPEGEARFVAESLHGAYCMIEGAGHYPQTEMPEITIPAALSFFNALPLQAEGEPASHAA
jgi:pimeloyl-ACP methyl ester carboxylesterase